MGLDSSRLSQATWFFFIRMVANVKAWSWLSRYQYESQTGTLARARSCKAPVDPGQRQGPLLQDPPRYGGAPQPFRGGGGGPPRRGGGHGGGGPSNYGGADHGGDFDGYGGGPGPQYGPGSYDQDNFGGGPPRGRFGGRDNFRNGGPRGLPPGPFSGPQGPHGEDSEGHQGSVMMVYGLNHERMNCDKVFNLFCLYGNVLRVKFLKTKEGCAMVQMGESISVDRTVYSLNNLEFFDKKMQLAFSKQSYLNEVQSPYELPDGSPSFKDFSKSRNNRFMNSEAASKNRISAPSKMLHFFNTPFGITEEELKIVFSEANVNAPVSIKMFTSKTERSSSGLMEFENITDAVEAITCCNHAPISNQNTKFPFMMKLCFSSSNQRN